MPSYPLTYLSLIDLGLYIPQLEALMGLFACTRVGDLGLRWRYDTAVVCFTGDHAAWAFGLGVPGLVLLLAATWGAVAHLRSHAAASSLRSGRALALLGIVHGQYRDDLYLWELALITGKALLFSICLFPSLFQTVAGQVSGPQAADLL